MSVSSAAQALVRMDINIFESGEFADCKVICGGREFKTHRLILSYRSQYFRKALNGKWEESQTGEVKLEDHEPQKVEWLLRFIYHQDLEWHRAQCQGKDSIYFLPMLVELVDLGDYFLVDGLIDAAREAILDFCSTFAVKFRHCYPDEPTQGDGIVPSVDRFLDGVMKAINLTSATSGPTRLLRDFFFKLIIDVFACSSVFSARSDVLILADRRQFRVAAKLRDIFSRLPDLEDELRAALYQSAFPKLRQEVSDSSWDSYVQSFTPEKTCSACSCYLGGVMGFYGGLFADGYGSGRGAYCLRCAKKDIFCMERALKSDWRNFMMHDGSKMELFPVAPASTGQDLPDATV